MRREPARRRPAVLTVPAYLEAVERMHGLGRAELARAVRVSPSVLRRWQRGTLVPTLGRLRTMTGLWGGSFELLALGAALQRFCRTTGLTVDDAVRMLRSGRVRQAARPARPAATRDRRQLSLPMERARVAGREPSV